ncbi:MAG: dephospho-CoA kinase [Bacteroidales bacterium]|nr:dephospho-CoA kinase [Bacteroidales bacterium]
MYSNLLTMEDIPEIVTILVTGGIGSGKSLVCRMLEERGVAVYDFDGRTKALYDEDPELLDNVLAAMRPYIPDGYPDEAEGLLTSEGKLDRQALAAVIFNDPHALADLEAVVHPAVLKDFEEWRNFHAERQLKEGRSRALVAAESAVALEKPLFRGLFDKVILVDAPLELRRGRAAGRDGVSEETVERRMLSQRLMNDISRGALAPDVDYIIENDKDEAALAARTDIILTEILMNYED